MKGHRRAVTMDRLKLHLCAWKHNLLCLEDLLTSGPTRLWYSNNSQAKGHEFSYKIKIKVNICGIC